MDKQFTLRIVGNVDVLMTMYENPLWDTYSHLFLGRVESLFDYYHNARHVLLPVSEGQGISIKTIECLSYGKSMVSTPLAFRGFTKLVPEALSAETANTGDEMREKIMALDVKSLPKQDKRTSDFYEELFSVEAQTEVYRSILK
jgi:hypothetical protein